MLLGDLEHLLCFQHSPVFDSAWSAALYRAIFASSPPNQEYSAPWLRDNGQKQLPLHQISGYVSPKDKRGALSDPPKKRVSVPQLQIYQP